MAQLNYEGLDTVVSIILTPRIQPAEGADAKGLQSQPRYGCYWIVGGLAMFAVLLIATRTTRRRKK